MRRAPLCLALIAAAPAFAQNTIADWFPVHIGDRWTYEHETRDGGIGAIAHPEINRWKTEETMTWGAPHWGDWRPLTDAKDRRALARY
jgi:hypothetical protein